MKNCILILFLFVFAQNTFGLDFSYTKDNQYNINQITENNTWNSFDATNKSLGFDSNAYWFKLNLNKKNIERVLSLENSHLDYIDYYLIDKNGKIINEIKTGDLRNYNSREILTNFFTFRVPADECTIYLKIKTQGVLILTAKIFSSTVFFETNNTRWGFYWITFGIALCSFIFNLIFYVKIKDTLFLKYLVLTVAIIVYLLTNYSFHFQYFFPNSPYLNQYNTLFFIFPILYIPMFCLSIFKKSKYEKLIIKFEYSIVIIGIVLVILNQTMGYNFTLKVGAFTSLILIVLSSISSIIFSLNQTTLEKIYITIGVNIYLLFYLTYVLVMPGAINSNIIIENSLEIGSSIMLMFAFLSVVNKYEMLKTEFNNSKNRIIELLEKQAYEIKHRNKILEEKVKERTNILEERNSEIETQNEQLHQQWQYVNNQRQQLEEQFSIITEKQKIIDEYNTNLEKIVSERTNDLQKTNQLLEATNSQLSHYTFITAHNLRAPIASMIGLMQLLKRENKPFDVSNEIFKRVDNSANKLNAVVRDLSTFLQSPSLLKKHYELINLNLLITDLLELIEVDIKDTKTKINWKFKGKEEIFSVKVFIQSIFFNIILNSIKYRKANESPIVTIEIDSIIDNDFCKITFTDNGLGIEIDNLEDFQLKAQNSTNAGGLGLGLTIIKKQITALHGKMLIDGKNNIGTTFTVWIPKAIPNDI